MYGNILPLNDSYSLANVRAHGATHYYDKSLDDDPPSWSDTGEEVFVEGVSNIHLFKGVNYSVPKL